MYRRSHPEKTNGDFPFYFSHCNIFNQAYTCWEDCKTFSEPQPGQSLIMQVPGGIPGHCAGPPHHLDAGQGLDEDDDWHIQEKNNIFRWIPSLIKCSWLSNDWIMCYNTQRGERRQIVYWTVWFSYSWTISAVYFYNLSTLFKFCTQNLLSYDIGCHSIFFQKMPGDPCSAEHHQTDLAGLTPNLNIWNKSHQSKPSSTQTSQYLLQSKHIL